MTVIRNVLILKNQNRLIGAHDSVLKRHYTPSGIERAFSNTKSLLGFLDLEVFTTIKTTKSFNNDSICSLLHGIHLYGPVNLRCAAFKAKNFKIRREGIYADIIIMKNDYGLFLADIMRCTDGIYFGLVSEYAENTSYKQDSNTIVINEFAPQFITAYTSTDDLENLQYKL